MVGIFGATSTTEEVLSSLNLHGKRILTTGVSAGIGVNTARSLAPHGAQVVGAARLRHFAKICRGYKIVHLAYFSARNAEASPAR